MCSIHSTVACMYILKTKSRHGKEDNFELFFMTDPLYDLSENGVSKWCLTESIAALIITVFRKPL